MSEKHESTHNLHRARRVSVLGALELFLDRAYGEFQQELYEKVNTADEEVLKHFVNLEGNLLFRTVMIAAYFGLIQQVFIDVRRGVATFDGGKKTTKTTTVRARIGQKEISLPIPDGLSEVLSGLVDSGDYESWEMIDHNPDLRFKYVNLKSQNAVVDTLVKVVVYLRQGMALYSHDTVYVPLDHATEAPMIYSGGHLTIGEFIEILRRYGQTKDGLFYSPDIRTLYARYKACPERVELWKNTIERYGTKVALLYGPRLGRRLSLAQHCFLFHDAVIQAEHREISAGHDLVPFLSDGQVIPLDLTPEQYRGKDFHEIMKVLEHQQSFLQS